MFASCLPHLKNWQNDLYGVLMRKLIMCQIAVENVKCKELVPDKYGFSFFNPEGRFFIV